MFICLACNFKTHLPFKYVAHMSRHRNVHNFKFSCGINNCQAILSSYFTFKRHFTRNHSHTHRQKVKDSDLIALVCNVPLCKKKFDSARCLVAHLKKHVRNNTKIQCCFKLCLKSFKNVSSFSSHISRCHKNLSEKESTETKNANIDKGNNCNSINSCDSSAEIENVDDCAISKMNMSKEIALFTFMLETKCLVPSVTVQKILEELHILLSTDKCNFSNLFKKHLNSIENLTSEQKESIIDAAEKAKVIYPLLCPKSGTFRSIHLRNKFFKENLNYIAPREIVLGRNKFNIEQYYHYVPIKESLCALLKNESVKKQLEFPVEKDQTPLFSEIMSDIHDGCSFKARKIFEDKSILQIILYQDVFELANPLGSAKGNQKLIGVYFTLGNFYAQYRSSVEHLQLLLLCKETNLKLFGSKKVFEALLKDLKELENGIVMDGIKITAALFCIVGDNLGQHFIGGFIQNFSKSNYMCRYCLLKRSDFKKMKVPLLNAEARTPVNYDFAVNNLDINVDYEGIRSKSIFNDLKYFHVCLPGLPPCLGHDLFEGIVASDLFLYVNYFIKTKKWFTYNELNNLIRRTHLKGNDTNNKPIQFNEKGKKLVGNASENWCTLRFFPIIVYNIVDTSNAVWRLLLHLREIVEFIISPKITHAQIAYLKVLIDEYLEQRIKLFPSVPLKPKHHFLHHYPELIFQFGPLIRLWTLRFESKHSYFKRVARRCQNFRNITKTLSVKHQLLQAYNLNGAFFPQSLNYSNGCTFRANLYDVNIQNAVQPLCASDELFMTNKIEINGTTYSSGQFLQLKNEDFYTSMGEIQFVLISHGVPYFLVTEWKGVWFLERGIFSLHPLNIFKLVKHASLIDFYPLSPYIIKNEQFIVLKHKIAY